MGCPKALLRHKGATFLENTLAAVRASSLGQEVVVLGHHKDEILAEVDVAHWVYNKEYEKGMTTSIQAGIGDLRSDVHGAMIFLVDHPISEVSTIELLIDSFEPGHVTVPVFGHRRGHPVIFSRDVLEEILSLPADTGANMVVRRDPERIIQVTVRDQAVVADIDSPEQFDKWKRSKSY